MTATRPEKRILFLDNSDSLKATYRKMYSALNHGRYDIDMNRDIITAMGSIGRNNYDFFVAPSHEANLAAHMMGFAGNSIPKLNKLEIVEIIAPDEVRVRNYKGAIGNYSIDEWLEKMKTEAL